MIIEFDEATHAYRIDGQPAAGVTSILTAEGLTDFSYCDEADRKRGQYVHQIAALVSRNWSGSTPEEIVQNSRWDPTATDPALVGYGYAAASYLLDTGFRPELIETAVGSSAYSVCGTPDAWGAGRLVDYKSGQPAAGARIQTALYAMMLEETYGLKTDERVLVWLKKDRTYKAFPGRPAGGEDLAAGLSALNLYRWRKANGLF